MGRSSGRWVKSLVGLGKSESTQQATEKSSYGGKSGRWNLWKASSKDLGSIWKGGKGSRRRSASEVSDGSSVTGDVTFGVVLAAAAHARPREFKVLRQEWAAIRIQTAFRGFLAKRALRALKAVVRIQALVKGWLVRKQAAVTLKCMQSLVRVQARARAHRVCSSTEASDLKKMMPGMQRTTSDHLKLAEGGWCNRKGTVEDIRAKSDMKRDGVIRRERALAYSQSQQLKRSNSKRNSSPVSFRSNKDDDSSRQVGWLEKWMASKAWDHRPSGQSCSDISEFYSSKQDEEVDSKPTKFSHPDKKSGRKIDGGSRTPMNSNSKHFQDHSTSSTSDILYAGNSASPSSISTPLSSASFSVQKRTESNNGRLNNGVSAKSLKAKSSSSGSHMTTTERRFFGEKLPCNSSNRKSKIGLCPDHSNNFSTSSQMKLRGPKGKSSNCNKENFQPYKNTPASVIMF